MSETWYRYYDIQSSSEAEPELEEYRVLRHTEKGVWINHWEGEKFILNNARRRFAYPTKELALDSYIRRKEKQVLHAKNLLAHAEAMLYQAQLLQRGEKYVRPNKFSFLGLTK